MLTVYTSTVAVSKMRRYGSHISYQTHPELICTGSVWEGHFEASMLASVRCAHMRPRPAHLEATPRQHATSMYQYSCSVENAPLWQPHIVSDPSGARLYGEWLRGSLETLWVLGIQGWIARLILVHAMSVTAWRARTTAVYRSLRVDPQCVCVLRGVLLA